MARKHPISRTAIERGEVESDTLQGKLDEEDLKESSERRADGRRALQRLLKMMEPGQPLHNKRVEIMKAAFKGHDLEHIAQLPGGGVEAAGMLVSLLSATKYLAEKQNAGHATNAELDYDAMLEAAKEMIPFEV